jgi:phospho-N-acetylmuramoyl-pentapeptide-transferase
MLIWLLDRFSPFGERLEFLVAGDSQAFVSGRAALAGLTAFLIVLMCGPRAIRRLQQHAAERIASDSARLNELHQDKARTPTMGGLLIVAAFVVAVLLWGDLANSFTRLGLFTVVAYGCLGAIDDWTKLRTDRNGMSARKKFQFQSLLAAFVAVGLWWALADIPRGRELIWPFGNHGLDLGYGYIPWAMLVLVATSNAVNLTDGLDGLATGCSICSAGAFSVIASLAGHRVLSDSLSIPYIPGSGEIAILLGALVGGLFGFLWFNCYPARVFMGDTGSLAIGALLAFSALSIKQELLLALVGGVFVVETLSVILQVAWFKRTRRRLLSCSPLHNHYVFQGEHEVRIVTRFWIASALLAILGLAGLKLF